jgi:hypothetical protein
VCRLRIGREAALYLVDPDRVESQKHAPPDMALTLDQVDVQGDYLQSVWTCTSPAFAQPMRGQDLWTIRDGKIYRLETTFLDLNA